MAVIRNVTPNTPAKELKAVYLNRKANGLEKGSWKKFKDKYSNHFGEDHQVKER